MVNISMIIGALVIMTFITMITVIIRGSQAKVYVFDEFNNVHTKIAREKEDSVSFKYNAHSRGGVSVEGNKYKSKGRKRIYLYRDQGGTLLPITDYSLTENVGTLDFSTSQEKRFETEALENISKKIDNTWAAWLKPLAGSFIIVMGAAIVSIVMVQNALEIEPVPEPQSQMFVNTTNSIQDLVESNREMVETIQEEKSNNDNNENSPPR